MWGFAHVYYFDRPSVRVHSRCDVLLNTDFWQQLMANFADIYGKKDQIYGCFLAAKARHPGNAHHQVPVPNTHHTDAAEANSLCRHRMTPACKGREPLPLHQFSHCGHLWIHQTAVNRIVLETAPWCFSNSANSLCSV